VLPTGEEICLSLPTPYIPNYLPPHPSRMKSSLIILSIT
jgi:hypothetical protein